jgi:hypothetical protein
MPASPKLITHRQADLMLCELIIDAIVDHDSTIRSKQNIPPLVITTPLHSILGETESGEGTSITDRLVMDMHAARVLSYGPEVSDIGDFSQLIIRSANSNKNIELKCSWSFWMVCFEQLQIFRGILQSKLLPKNRGAKWGRTRSRHEPTSYERQLAEKKRKQAQRQRAAAQRKRNRERAAAAGRAFSNASKANKKR